MTPLRAEEPVVRLRTGSHDGFGRLVFDWPDPVGYRVEQEGSRIAVRFEAPAEFRLAAARGRVRNVVSVREEAGAILVQTSPGTRLRHFRIGSRVVLDLYDATSDPAPAGPAASPAPQAGVAVPVASPPAVPAWRRVRAEAGGDPPAPAVGRPRAPAPPAEAGMPAPPADVQAPAGEAAPAVLALAVPQHAAAAPQGREPPRPAEALPPETERDARDAFAAIETLNPNLGTALGMSRYFVERNLRQLGYGTEEVRPMPERLFREAVRAYQRRIGAEPTGALTPDQRERMLHARSILSESRLTAGPMMVVEAESRVLMAGTWTIEGGQPEHPVNRSQITCDRRPPVCTEAAARVALAEGEAGGVLVSELVTYRVVSWTPGEIRAELGLRCVTRVLVVRPWTSQVTLLDRPHATLACRREAEISPGIRVLWHGAEAIARHYDERRAAAAGDISPGLRAILSHGLTGEAEPAAVAARR